MRRAALRAINCAVTIAAVPAWLVLPAAAALLVIESMTRFDEDER